MGQQRDTDQWRRRACRKADNPSMRTSTAMVRQAQNMKTKTSMKAPPRFCERKPILSTMVHSTSDSSVRNTQCAQVTQPILHLALWSHSPYYICTKVTQPILHIALWSHSPYYICTKVTLPILYIALWSHSPYYICA